MFISVQINHTKGKNKQEFDLNGINSAGSASQHSETGCDRRERDSSARKNTSEDHLEKYLNKYSKSSKI